MRPYHVHKEGDPRLIPYGLSLDLPCLVNLVFEFDVRTG